MSQSLRVSSLAPITTERSLASFFLRFLVCFLSFLPHCMYLSLSLSNSYPAVRFRSPSIFTLSPVRRLSIFLTSLSNFISSGRLPHPLPTPRELTLPPSRVASSPFRQSFGLASRFSARWLARCSSNAHHAPIHRVASAKRRALPFARIFRRENRRRIASVVVLFDLSQPDIPVAFHRK